MFGPTTFWDPLVGDALPGLPPWDVLEALDAFIALDIGGDNHPRSVAKRQDTSQKHTKHNHNSDHAAVS